MNKIRVNGALTLLICAGLILASCAGLGQETDGKILRRRQGEIQDILDYGNLTGMQIALVQGGKLAGTIAFGDNMDVDTVLMNGSVQKSFDAAAVLQLHERGLIDLDDDINQYLDFPVRHPDYPDRPITFQMLLSHRSGLEDLKYQFSWDTECAFYPDFRNTCNLDLVDLPLEDFLQQSFSPDGSNYDPGAWVFPPGEHYLYSVSAYPLLRYLIQQVSGQPYPQYMEQNLFQPLGMGRTGFSIEEFPSNHSQPYTRVRVINTALPAWSGNGYQMHTTAEDMAKFSLALIQNGSYQGQQILEKETVELMQAKTTPGNKMPDEGYGLGLIHYQNGWLGHGGSTVGYQTLWMFNPNRKCGLVIMTNINGILGSREDFNSIWLSVASVRDLLLADLHPLARYDFFPHGLIALTFLISLTSITISLLRKRQERKKL